MKKLSFVCRNWSKENSNIMHVDSHVKTDYAGYCLNQLIK